MPTALFIAPNGGGPGLEWAPFRTEGRYAVNFAFGLAEMGWDVEIVCGNFPGDGVIRPHVKVLQKMSTRAYDLGFCYSCYQSLNANVINKRICMGINDQDPANFRGTCPANSIFVYPFKNWEISHKVAFPKDKEMKMAYFPPLFPIPSHSKKFLECKYVKGDKLKVLVNNFCWGGSPKPTRNYMFKVLDGLEKLGYKLDVRELSYDEERAPAKYKIARYQSPIPYKNVYEHILWSDICITPWVTQGSSMQLDFVSLGKPLVCLEPPTGKTVKYPWSPLYKNMDDLFFMDEPIEDKLARFMRDPIKICERQQEVCRDSEFETWKKVISPLL